MCFRTSAELAAGEPRDIAFLDEHFPAVRLHQPNDVAEGDTFAGSAAPEEAEGLARWNLEREIVEDRQRPKGLGHVIESHRDHPDTGG